MTGAHKLAMKCEGCWMNPETDDKISFPTK